MSRILIALPLVTIILLILLWRHFSRYDVPALPSLLPPNSNDSITIPTADTDTNSLPHFYDPALLSFWEHLSKALDAAAPKCTLPSPLPTATPAKFAEIRKDFAERPDLLNLPSTDVEDLKAAHERYVACLPNLAPKLPYARGSKGIVTTASGAYLPPLLVSLRMLRRTGSVLPVEVWMENQSVYEAQLCEHALPRLNATCKIMDRILSTGSHHVNLTGYQLKSFAMLLSDFDSMLLLDADTIPVALPETMMESEPFMSEGFISWPDYVSPPLHTKTQIPPPSKANKPTTVHHNNLPPLPHPLLQPPTPSLPLRQPHLLRPTPPQVNPHCPPPPRPLLQPPRPHPLLPTPFPRRPCPRRQRNLPRRRARAQRNQLQHRHPAPPSRLQHQ